MTLMCIWLKNPIREERGRFSPYSLIINGLLWAHTLEKLVGWTSFQIKSLEKALWYALKKFPEYDVVMEGILASTVFSTYSDIFHRVEEKYPDTKVIVFNMLPPFETCLERVYSRNGGKPVKEEQIEYKWKIVQRNIQKFKNEGFITLKVDTSKVSKEDMLPKFLKTVNKYKEE